MFNKVKTRYSLHLKNNECKDQLAPFLHDKALKEINEKTHIIVEPIHFSRYEQNLKD